MYKTIVAHPIAKKLKDCGLSIECMNYYTADGCINKGRVDDYWGDNLLCDWNSMQLTPFKPFKECISAPTYIEVQNWIMETYNIYIEIFTNRNNKWGVNIIKDDNGIFTRLISEQYIFTSKDETFFTNYNNTLIYATDYIIYNFIK